MASPFAARGHSIWDARSIDQADGSNVDTWEANLNGADGTYRSGAHATLDADGCGGDAAVVFPAATLSFGFATFQDANISWTMLFRLERGACSEYHWAIYPATSDFTSVGGILYDPLGRLRAYANDDFANSNLYTNADTAHTIAIRYNYSTDQVDLFVDGVRSEDGPFAAGSQAYETARQLRIEDLNLALRIQAVHVVPDLLTDGEVATLHTYSATLDTDYAGGVTCTLTFDGLLSDSEVRIYEQPHPCEWTIDFTGIAVADLDGCYFTFQVQGESSVSSHYAWFDLDNGSTDPAPAGLTGHAIDVATGDTDDEIAAATAAVLAAITDLDATDAATVVTVIGTRNGELHRPEDSLGATATGAGISVIAIGGTSEEEVDGIENSSGTSWVGSTIVVYPRRFAIVVIRVGSEPIRIEDYIMLPADTRLPVNQREDLNYLNP